MPPQPVLIRPRSNPIELRKHLTDHRQPHFLDHAKTLPDHRHGVKDFFPNYCAHQSDCFGKKSGGDRLAEENDDYLRGNELEGFTPFPIDEANYQRLQSSIAPSKVRLERLDDTRGKLRELFQSS